MYDEKDGRHVQMGEPGKSVSGYFTSRSLDGLMEYKTMYEADENGYRARGDHLPVATAKAESRSDDAYIFNYEAPGSHQHYQMGQPGVAVQGSFMYYDPDGKARTVNYIADEKGYRIKTDEPEVVKISETNSQPAAALESVPASSAPVQAELTKATVAVAEPIKAETAVAEAEPVKVEPASEPVASAVELKLEAPALPEPVIEPQPVVLAADPISEIAAAVVEEPVAIPVVETPVVDSVAPVAETKSGEDAPADILADSVLPYIALPIVVHPGPYFRSSSIPYVKPTFRFSPFGYSHGYNYGYPFTAGNFVYAL